MRRFALYIVLNSELPVLNELVSTDSTIDLLIWTVPTIPKCLMSEMLWRFGMETYVYEIISFSYPQLALEVADALLLNLKYFNPTECVKQLQTLSTACFRTLCRINFFTVEENQLQFGFNNFQKCMTYFCNPPNESKLEQLRKDDLYKYYGNCLHTILSVLQECLDQFNETQTYHLNETVALYSITYKNDINKTDYTPCNCGNKSVLEILNKCLEDLLDKCMKLVMGINLDIFCAWSEFEEKGVSMQETLGNLCYKVRQRLLNSDVCEHPVVSMLEQISRKPLNITEVINTTDSSVIVENIKRNDKESSHWLQALIRKDTLHEDPTLLELLNTSFDQLNNDNCYELFQKLVNIDTKNEVLKLLKIKAYQGCSTAIKTDLIDIHFTNVRFNNSLECKQFSSMLTEVFNKLAVTPESDLSEVLTVFIQNPRKVYIAIFKSAIENEQQTDLMLKVMIFLNKFSDHYYSKDTEPCLIVVLKNAIDEELDTSVKQDNLIRFISKLKEARIISGPKLLVTIIMPKLHTALVSKNMSDINMQCKLLHQSYSALALLQFRAPMLAMLAQVMAQVRWNISTFDTIAPTTLKLVIDLQTSLMDTYKGNIPGKQVSWLKSKVKELDPLNMYYYRQLWDPPGNTFVEIISGIHIHKNMDSEMLTLWLAKVLCSTTSEEWDSIWESLKDFGDVRILDFFHSALLSVLSTEKSYHTNVTWSCLLYCYGNFVKCIRYKFFKEPLSSSHVTIVTNKLLTVIKSVQEDKIDELGTVLMPLFAYISQKKEDYKIDISHNLKRCLPQSNLSVIINSLFSNGST
ncbi:uncharacterized protein [Epargyreus clarus]